MKNFKQYIKEEEKTYKPNAGMASAAKKAIEWKEKHGKEVDAGTQTGWVRARQLANRDEVSLDIVKRMHSFFSRHEGNQKIAPEHKDEPWKDNGHVAWLIWGGDAGKAWAESIVKSLDESVENLEEAAKGKYYYHVTLQKYALKIIKQGIRPLMPSNWVRADGTRYNEDGGIFAFDHPEDAARWAFKMAWDTKKKTVIVRIKKTSGWDKDPSDDITIQMGKGKALKRYDSVKASDIVDVVQVDTKGKDFIKNHVKALLEPVVRPQDMDWHDNFLNINRKIMSEDEIE